MYDPESGNPESYSAFSDKAVRQGFIRKVYGILCVQLTITFGFVAVVHQVEAVRLAVATNLLVIIPAIVTVFVTIIVLLCCGVHRKFPLNFIFLGLFTAAESVLVGIACANPKYKDNVLWAVLITAVIVIALTIFAFQTKIDFTVFHGLMFCLLIALMMMGILMIFVKGPKILMVYNAFGALIFSGYIVIDTQMIIGGGRKYEISPEDYILGAITLYLDVINLFLHILRLLNAAKS